MAPKPRRQRAEPLPHTFAWDGGAVRARMSALGVTEEWVADRTGYPARVIRNWLANRNEPSGSKARALAEALDCDVDRFFRRVAPSSS